jgi:hypothetical protein
MITINGVQYTNEKIIINTQQFKVITFVSSASVINWTIVKYPDSYNDSVYSLVFNSSSSKTSSHVSESLDVKLSGVYYITAIERDISGNYTTTNIYIKVEDAIIKGITPFVGQDIELDSVNGWGKNIEKQLYNLSSKPLDICKTVCSAELAINTLVFITGIYEKVTSSLTYSINTIANCTDVNAKIGIVINKIDVNPLETDLNKRFIYIVLFSGVVMITDTTFTLTVDANKNFYYSTATHGFTNVTSDYYVGKYFNTEKILIIDEIFKYGSIKNNISGTFTTVDDKTITVLNGMVTGIAS